jgi:hypothetical protein
MKTTKVTWATPTTIVVEESSPIPISTPKTGETKAILKGSTQNIHSSLSLVPDSTPKPNAMPEAVSVKTAPERHEAELHHHHSPVGQRMSSGSSGYSATDDVDYLKWISESATRPRAAPDFVEKRTESCEESSGCSPDGVESPDTMREEVTPSPQRGSSPDSGYEHGNGKTIIFLIRLQLFL